MAKNTGSTRSVGSRGVSVNKGAEANATKVVKDEANWRKTADTPLRKKGDIATGSVSVGKRKIDIEVERTDKGYYVSIYDREGNIGYIDSTHITTLTDLSKHVKHKVSPQRKLDSYLGEDGEVHYFTRIVTPKKLEEQKVKNF